MSAIYDNTSIGISGEGTSARRRASGPRNTPTTAYGLVVESVKVSVFA
jgi:hypothetical protein